MKQRKIVSWIVLVVMLFTASIAVVAEQAPQEVVEETPLIAKDDVVGSAFGKEILYKDIFLQYGQMLSVYTQYGIDPT
ncbi:MAG: hypothetical protein GX786_01990, partial [Clostridiales bacterium]|nr:hypothetical protein [Clostridiales bacterium]